MSITYADLPNTNYPDTKDAFKNKKDADATVATLIARYKNRFNSGNYALAKSILESNPALADSMITADDFNKLQDAVMAMQRFYQRDQQQIIFSSTEPTGENEQAVGDVWVKLKDGGNELYEKTTSGYTLRLSSPTIVAQANKLATARKIGNANFDGTANITLAQIGAATIAQGTKADNAMPKANFSYDSTTKTLNITL